MTRSPATARSEDLGALPAAAVGGANPVLVEVTRGPAVESRHRGAVAVFDASGGCIAAWGDVDRPVFPRSAVKPLQALPLIESGAAEYFAVSDAEIALACASHGGEPAHVEAVGRWLARLDLDMEALECGAHPPAALAAAAALMRAGRAATALHNNCSGKHTGMIATALHLGEPIAGYVKATHPVQQRIRQVLAEMCGVDLSAAPTGTDGCSIPTIAIPLSALAVGMARLANPAGLDARRADACRRIRAAMTSHPFNVAGSGRFCTAILAAAGGTAIVKTGAEGVYCGALPGPGLGIALKIDDGATRAGEVAMAAILRHLGAFDDAVWRRLADFTRPTLRNRNGLAVGEVRPAPCWLKGV